MSVSFRYPMDDPRKWKAIYRLLNKVSTREFDCGQLCGSACCGCGDSSEELGIYLFPGEYRFLKEEGAMELGWIGTEQQDPRELGFPDSWMEPVYFLHCNTAPSCPRHLRPLQCRTFPLKPVIGENGVLEMIWNDEPLPYQCPLIAQNLPVHDDYYKATYTVWTHLLQDPRFMDLVLSWSGD